MLLDDEEEFNKLCGSCQSKSKDKKCVGCGKHTESQNNPNFDDSKFEEMKRKSGGDN